MAKIVRKTQKVFAQDAVNNGQFGSAQLGTKVTSSDLDTLQALNAFLEGWSSATLGGGNLPTLEEMQALHYITTTQIGYLMQEGMPEYDSATEYHQFSIVKKTGTYELYGSKINDNVGNALPAQVDDANWQYLGDLASLSDTAIADGDYGDITVSGGGTVWNIDAGVVGTTELANLGVTAAKIANSTITGSKIASSTVASSNMTNTGVGAGSYTSANITVDSAGRVTAASNGSSVDTQQIAKAWVNFDGSSTVSIRDSFNVSSVSDGGTGRYSVNFSTSMANNAFATVGMVRTVASLNSANTVTYASTTLSNSLVDIRTNSDSAASDALICSIVVFGDQ